MIKYVTFSLNSESSCKLESKPYRAFKISIHLYYYYILFSILFFSLVHDLRGCVLWSNIHHGRHGMCGPYTNYVLYRLRRAHTFTNLLSTKMIQHFVKFQCVAMKSRFLTLIDGLDICCFTPYRHYSSFIRIKFHLV